MNDDRLGDLVADIATCRRCPRLVAWREEVARVRVARHRGSVYWGRPVPGFGDPRARVLLVGLAPAAHAGNRTGRVFTGDNPGGSGELLFAALHRAGLSPRPRSASADDGLVLQGAYIAAAVRCAPPANRPSIDERDACLPYLSRELALLGDVRVIVALGGFAWEGVLRVLAGRGLTIRPRPRFAHGAHVTLGPYQLLGCYHPSQQNTFTGRLDANMLEAILIHARGLGGLPPGAQGGPETTRDKHGRGGVGIRSAVEEGTDVLGGNGLPGRSLSR
jgi:uracil-DNA glycosylase family 4